MSLFGLDPDALTEMRALCERTPGVERVWIFGSRTRDDWRPRSDVDLAVDAPNWTLREFCAFEEAMRQLPMVYQLDMVHWQTVTDSGLERDVACYLDSQAALQWWHRNVAKAQYGLQGWKRNKVYPDFVFARMHTDGQASLVVLETKGLHLKGSGDTAYKQTLLERLTQAFARQSLNRAGEMEVIGDSGTVVCDLVFETDWRGTLNARHFGKDPGARP